MSIENFGGSVYPGEEDQEGNAVESEEDGGRREGSVEQPEEKETDEGLNLSHQELEDIKNALIHYQARETGDIRVTVKRTSGEIDPGWTVKEISHNQLVRVVKEKPDGNLIEKIVPIFDLYRQNKDLFDQIRSTKEDGGQKRAV